MQQRTIIVILVILFSALLISLFVYWQWNFYGVVTEEKKKTKLPAIERREPELYTRNRRVRQGEMIAVKDLAKACDETGKDVSYLITYTDEKGNLLQGKLDTTKAGVHNITVSVKSPTTGRKVSRPLILLVDGRVLK